MDIRLADNCGFCFGVKRAVSMALEAADKEHHKTVTLGPIIHNPQVVGKLVDKGVGHVDSVDQVDSGTMIIRSHGVGPEVYQEAQAKDLEIIDATCPHVKKAQQDAKSIIEDGRTLIILGEKNHPEVKSINLWAGNHGIILEDEESAQNLPMVEKMGVVVQSTF